MTPTQRWLITSAEELLEYMDRLEQGGPFKGMYEDICLKRNLKRALEAVKGEDATFKALDCFAELESRR